MTKDMTVIRLACCIVAISIWQGLEQQKAAAKLADKEEGRLLAAAKPASTAPDPANEVVCAAILRSRLTDPERRRSAATLLAAWAAKWRKRVCRISRHRFQIDQGVWQAVKAGRHDLTGSRPALRPSRGESVRASMPLELSRNTGLHRHWLPFLPRSASADDVKQRDGFRGREVKPHRSA
ncbi:MAG: hypothetical protein N3A66_06920, partial [Planctomycetota bacterium]|nr:hypothetical protein [Planctomycetota bacterium]